MTTVTPEQVMHRMRWLPERLREKCDSSAWEDALAELAVAWKLTAEQRDELSRIVSLVFLAFIHPDNVASEIAEALGQQKEASELLARLAEERSFGPYRKLIERKYAPPVPVPKNSPIYAVSGVDADDYLRSAVKRAAQVNDEIVGHRLTAEGLGRQRREPVMPRPMRDHQRKYLDIAVAEVTYAESLDDSMVVFISDDEFLDDDEVRRLLHMTAAELDESAGLYESSREFINRALAIRDDFGTRMIATTANAVVGDFEAALKHARRAVELSSNAQERHEAQELLQKLAGDNRQIRISRMPGVLIMDEHRKYLSDDDIASISSVLLMETDRPVRSSVLLVKGPKHDYAEVMLFDTDKFSDDPRHVVASVFIHKQLPGRWAPGLRPSRPELAVHIAKDAARETLYYVHTQRDDITYGPVTGIMIRDWLQARCILPTDMVCVVGAKEWSPIEASSFLR